MSVMSTSGTTNLIMIGKKNKNNDVGIVCQAFIDLFFYMASIVLVIYRYILE